jgi:hypothetical protein
VLAVRCDFLIFVLVQNACCDNQKAAWVVSAEFVGGQASGCSIFSKADFFAWGVASKEVPWVGAAVHADFVGPSERSRVATGLAF